MPPEKHLNYFKYQRKMRNLLLLILLAFMPVLAFSQKNYYYSQLEVMRHDDGRVQYIDPSDNKPLKGECKVIANYRDKNTYYLTKYKNGFKDGKDVSYKRGRVEMECFYKEGFREGTLTEYFPGAEQQVKRVAHFKKGRPDGTDISYYTDGSIEKEINYKEGLQHGREVAYDYQTREVKMDCNYKNGKQDGKQMQRISSNVGNYIKESVYKDGELIDYKEYHHPGRTLRKSREGGKETLYRKDGSIESERNYVGDKMEGEQKTYYADGQIQRVSTYKDNYKHGPVKEYYPDGTLKLEENYEENARMGLAVEYYPNGQKQSEWIYDGFDRNGPFKIYYDNGAIKEEGEANGDEYKYRKIYYKNGQLKSYWMVTNGLWTEVESYDEDGKQK